MTVAVITARMQSTRIPNKVLSPICGRPILDWIVDRLRKCKKVNEIVLATPVTFQEKLWEWAESRKVGTFGGDEDDVILRLHQVAMDCGYEKVIRITGDLPFLDYEGVDALVENLTPDVDYVNNVYGYRTWLDGTNAEIAWADSVARACRMTPDGPCVQSHDRITVDSTWKSHGMYWMANSPHFKQKFIESEHNIEDIKHLTLMVDEPKDLLVAEHLMKRVLESEDDSYPNLLRILRREKTAIERIKFAS